MAHPGSSLPGGMERCAAFDGTVSIVQPLIARCTAAVAPQILAAFRGETGTQGLRRRQGTLGGADASGGLPEKDGAGRFTAE